MIKITIKFFGVLDEYFESDLILNINKQCEILYIKKYIKKYIEKNINNTNLKYIYKIIDKALFSDNKKILSNDFIISSDCVIYLLPPFSGG